MMLKRSIFISLLLVALLAPSALARTKVQVDGSFGSQGLVEARFGPHYRSLAFSSVAPQPDGALLAGWRNGSELETWARRYNADGSLDPSFTPPPISNQVEAVDAEGRVLRAYGAYEDFLERLNPDGTPDLSFGVRLFGTRMVSDATSFKIEVIEPLPSGKILVGGSIVVHVPESVDTPGRTYVEQVAVARFHQEGRLDSSFGGDGIVRLKSDFGIAGERLRGLAPRSDEGLEAIVLDALPTYSSEPIRPTGSTVVGIGPDGWLNSSYGSGGTIRLDDAAIMAFHGLPDGALFVAGDRWSAERPDTRIRESDLFLSRYTASGQLDSGFGGGDGGAVLDLAGIDLLGSALWEEDGSVWLGGSSSDLDSPNCHRFYRFCPETPFVSRFTTGGSPAPAFGSGGVLRLDELSYPYGPSAGGSGVLDLKARPGGGAFAAGGSGIAAFIAALEPSGALDPSFGNSGIVTAVESSDSRSWGQAMAIDSRGRILISGGTDADVVDSSPEAAVFRYLPNGELDRGFGGGSGYVRLPGHGDGVVVGEDDSAFVLSGRWEPAVTKVAANGRVDRSFGEEGTVQLYARIKVRRRWLYLKPFSVASLPGGRLLVAGTAGGSESRVFVLRLRADGSPDPSFGRGGMALLGFGPSRRCAAKQIAVQRDGRIVVAGYVMGSRERSEAFAVMRLRADGGRDRSFGDGGLTVARMGRRSYANALAIERNGRILVAGKALHPRKRIEQVLLRFTPKGGLDRGFGRGGAARFAVPRVPGGLSAQPRQVLLQRHRILVLRDHRDEQLVVYSRDGRRRQAFRVARGAEPGNRAVRAPFGAVQTDRLLLGWTEFHPTTGSFKLQRLRIGGRP